MSFNGFVAGCWASKLFFDMWMLFYNSASCSVAKSKMCERAGKAGHTSGARIPGAALEPCIARQTFTNASFTSPQLVRRRKPRKLRTPFRGLGLGIISGSEIESLI